MNLKLVAALSSAVALGALAVVLVRSAGAFGPAHCPDISGGPDGVRVLDGARHPLDLLVLTEGSVNAYTDLPLSAGRSGVFAVDCAARTAVLAREGADVGRLDFAPIPGEVVMPRW